MVDENSTALDGGDFNIILTSLKNLLDHIKYQDEIIAAYSQKVLIKPYLSIDGEAKNRQEKGSEEAGDIPQTQEAESRQVFEEARDLIVSQSEEIYKLKGKIREHDISIHKLQRTMKSGFRMIYETKARSEGKTDGETAGSKRLKGTRS
jgi:hypothetical protein